MDSHVEGCRAWRAVQVRIGALIEQPHREGKVAVDRGDEQRGCAVPTRHMIDIDTASFH